jgi:nicotinate-nucleotide adenylyltransferase
MRTGILGGSFDPIHMGHLIISETIRSDFPLDRVLWIPAALSPLKDSSGASADDRLQMTRLAAETGSCVTVIDDEIKRGGLSYTVETLRRLRSSGAYGSDELFFIMGSDGLTDWERWKEKDEILELATVLIVSRQGHSFEPVGRWKDRMVSIRAPLIGISSTEIRERIRSGLSIRYWVPAPVEDWIRNRGLYRS